MMWDQRILASIRRRDGHNIDGTPGDCLRASVASVLKLDYEDVPHFAQHRTTWWRAMRLHARSLGYDWACIRSVDDIERFDTDGLMVACGPSPRGSFWHAVVANAWGRIIHDPHPSRAGLESIEEFLIPVSPYDPAPLVRELVAR